MVFLPGMMGTQPADCVDGPEAPLEQKAMPMGMTMTVLWGGGRWMEDVWGLMRGQLK